MSGGYGCAYPTWCMEWYVIPQIRWMAYYHTIPDLRQFAVLFDEFEVKKK